jgi:outer membrane protein
MKKFLLYLFTLILLSQGALLSQQKVWTLEECVRYAIENNIQIKQQVVQTEMQKNVLDLSKYRLLPTIHRIFHSAGPSTLLLTGIPISRT